MNVSSFTQLKTALAGADPDIKLTKDIPILEPITIPKGKFITFGSCKFLGRGKSVVFDGGFDGWRKQYFSGFQAGEIKGSFSAGEVYPEWWGVDPQKAEIAINCAIQSYQHAYCGNRVSLAAGYYYVSGPIDLRATLSYLVGAASGATFIVATDEWNGKWEDWNFWKSEKETHCAMIWMGSVEPANQSFRTGVRGVTINSYRAAMKHVGKRVSGISSTGYIEENSIVNDIGITGFSGFGIGLTNNSISTVNGLSISNFWITNAIGKEAVAIRIPPHAAVASIRDGTIDARIGKEAADNGAEWPTYGMVVSGAHSVVDNVHIEGCGVGILAESAGPAASIAISNISTNHLMDYGMRYYNEPVPIAPAPSIEEQKKAFPGANHPYYSQYSTAVMIGRSPASYAASKAYNIAPVISVVRNQGRCKYLLRDGDYNISPFGRGQYPNSGCAALVFYARPESFEKAVGEFPYGDGSANFRNQFNEPFRLVIQ